MSYTDAMLDLKQYESINQQTKDLVNGWIRLNTLKNKDKLIPKCVNQICCIFFCVTSDVWNMELMSEVFTTDPNNDKLLHHSGVTGLRSAFLTNIVSFGKHCWTFKIINYGPYNLMFGIWNLESLVPTKAALDTYIGSVANTAYVFDFGFAELNIYDTNSWTGAYTYGQQCEIGSIIKMNLNMDDLTLSYCINDKDYGIAFQHIENTKYSAIITSFANQNCVELIKYEQFYK